MRRILLFALVGLAALAAAGQRLYLKDGSFQLVREYKVDGDRLKYFSAERGEWEEMPVAMVDLDRTRKDVQSKSDEQKKEAAALDAEEKAEREIRREIERVPQGFGTYLLQGEEAVALKAAESKFVTKKGRSVLAKLSPIPVISGKATIEIDGAHAPVSAKIDRPEFYIRLSAEERFGIIRLAPTKAGRLVENVEIIPVSKEMIETPDNVEIFRRQIQEGVYKIWPTEPLKPGEYAVVQYTQGKANPQIWDFSVPSTAR